MFQHWKIYNQRKVAIAEAKKKVEEQRSVAEKLERLEILEEEITIIRRDSRLSSLPPTGLESDSDFLVRRNGEIKNSILSMMAPVGIATNSLTGKSRPIPKPRSSSINSTSSQRGLLLSNIKSTNFSETKGHMNAAYDIVSDNVSDEVFVGNKTAEDATMVPRGAPDIAPSVLPSVVSSVVLSEEPSVVSDLVSAKHNTPSDALGKLIDHTNSVATENRSKPPTIRSSSKGTSSLLDNLNNLSKGSDVSEIKMAETFTNSVIKSAVIYAPNEAAPPSDTVPDTFPPMTLTLTAAGSQLLNEKWPNQAKNIHKNDLNKLVENDGQNEKIIYDDEDLPL